MTVAKKRVGSDLKTSTVPSLWKGQLLHFTGLSGLLIVLAFAWILLGRPHSIAFWIAAIIPVMHQVWVWFSWRCELQSSGVSRTIGFGGYLLVFFLLFFGRFLSLAYLAFIDRNSISLSPALVVLVMLILVLPGTYAAYSVVRYFGMKRAAGADHFEERFRKMPLVKEGIFRYSDNGMYLFAFLLFWAIAVGFSSVSALAIAAFSHAYIWVHFYATEKPDMDFLYGSPKS